MSNIGQKIKDVLTGHHDQETGENKTSPANATGASPADEPLRIEHTGHAHHDPEQETKQATSEAGNYPYWGNLDREQGEHVHRSEGPGSIEDSSRAVGAPGTGSGPGVAGVVGAGDHGTHNEDQVHGSAGGFDPAVYGTRESSQRPVAEAYKATPTTANEPFLSNDPKNHKSADAATPSKTASSGDNNSHRKEQAIAAGAGAGYLSTTHDQDRKGEEESSHTSGTHLSDSKTTDFHHQASSRTTTSSGQRGKDDEALLARAAAEKAWNKQEPVIPNTTEDGSRKTKHSDLGQAAAGTAFGAGSAGLGAQYGQGEGHENNTRTQRSDRITERALGSGGNANAIFPNEHSSGTGPSVSAGQPGSGKDVTKVLHKCDNCGHDNDISRYFNKVANFSSQQ